MSKKDGNDMMNVPIIIKKDISNKILSISRIFDRKSLFELYNVKGGRYWPPTKICSVELRNSLPEYHNIGVASEIGRGF